MQPLEPTILGLPLLEALGIRNAHAAELVAPEVVAGLRETVPAAQLGHRQSAIRSSQKANDLLLRKSLLHVQSPVLGSGLPAHLLHKSGGTSLKLTGTLQRNFEAATDRLTIPLCS